MTTAYDYDGFGNVTRERRRGHAPNSDDNGQPVTALEAVTETEYALNVAGYDGVIAIEHEDPTMSRLEGVRQAVRHLAPLLNDKTIERVEVLRPRVVRATSLAQFQRVLRGARFVDLTRRGKYLLFTLLRSREGRAISLLGHLGMTEQVRHLCGDQRVFGF